MLNNRSIAFALIVFLLLVYPYQIFAGTCGASHCTDSAPWTADSTSRADVDYCINTCMSSGETLNVPAGTGQTWSSRITIPGTLDNCTIQGNGIGNTVIDDYAFTLADGLVGIRVTGFEWDSTGIVATQNVPFYIGSSSTSTVTDYRIDHIKISNAPRFMYIQGDNRGVIDHSEFWNARISGICVLWGVNSVWDEDTNLGDQNFNFIEDNDFYASTRTINHAVWLNNRGGKFVVRYNEFHESNGHKFADPIDIHGYGHDNTSDASRAYEIYHNTFYRITGDQCCRAVQVRGGTGVIYENNTASGDDFSMSFIWFNEERAMDGIAATYAPHTWTSNPNCSSTGGAECRDYEEYPCCDQPGRGKDQALEPVYSWGNRDSNGDNAPAEVNDGTPYGGGQYSVEDYIVHNRDFYDENESYNPGVSTSCTSGVCRGTAANMALVTTCTEGVGFGQSDTDKLYICNDSNTFVLSYEPYTYPHPLIGGDSTAPTISSVTISANGENTTITWDETVVTTGYDDGDCQMTCTDAGSVDLNSISGSGSTRTFDNSTAVHEGETCTLACTAALGLEDNDIEDTSGNDMEDVSSQAVTESTYRSYPKISISSSNGKSSTSSSYGTVTVGN